MNFDDYMDATQHTAIFRQSCRNIADLTTDTQSGEDQITDLLEFSYLATKLNGEAGEVAELIAKAIRDDDGYFGVERLRAIKKELGDVLWYVAQLAHQCGYSLGEIASENLEKLRKRQEEGKLHGSGSDR